MSLSDFFLQHWIEYTGRKTTEKVHSPPTRIVLEQKSHGDNGTDLSMVWQWYDTHLWSGICLCSFQLYDTYQWFNNCTFVLSTLTSLMDTVVPNPCMSFFLNADFSSIGLYVDWHSDSCPSLMDVCAITDTGWAGARTRTFQWNRDTGRQW